MFNHPNSRNMKVSIIIVNYNTRELLRNSLISISKYVEASHEVIVVDNASKDDSVTILKPAFPHVHFIESKENLGFAAGNNLGLSQAVGDYIFFLNPDTELVDSSLDRLILFLDKNPKAGIAAPQLRYGNGTLQRSIRPFYSFWGSLADNRYMNPVLARFPRLNKVVPVILDHHKQSTVDWVKGAAILIRTDLVKEIGGFDEQFWIYGEEMDLCKQVWKRGYSINYLPDSIILHFEGQSTRQASQKMFIQNYKSFYLYLKKNHSKSELMWYHRRVLLFTQLFLMKENVKKVFRKKSSDVELYEALRVWVKTEGSLLANS
jgi:GT2 family glycosyltransferase